MKLTADTSVIVAAFASWHEHHVRALEAVARLEAIVAHCLLETYSVLTRLPAPHRMTPTVVSSYLQIAFGKHELAALSAVDHRELVARCAARNIAGGSVYDAAIAATCVASKLKLLTLDGRARGIYALLGVEHELIAS